MKICILINTLRSGGAERQAVNLAKMLKNNGHDVSIVTFFGENFFVNELKEGGIPNVNLHCTKAIKAIHMTRRQFKREQYDAVIAFLRSPILCACAASLAGKKWRLITRLGSANEAFFSRKAGKVLLGLIRIADSIVCNSNLEREMWCRHSTLQHDRIRVIYNIYPDISLQDVPIEMHEEHSRRILVIPASYSGIKNVRNVILAASMLNADERKRLEIHWYGHREIATGNTGEYDQAVKLVEKLGLEETVFLHDETRNIYDKMREADFVGLFSLFEGLPNAICEAMLLGVPIVMTEVSDYRELVKGNGFTCCQTSESICGALKKIIATTESQRRVMSLRSFENAKKLFSYEVLQREWLNILTE